MKFRNDATSSGFTKFIVCGLKEAHNKIGIHRLGPIELYDIEDAIQTAERDGFETIYLHTTTPLKVTTLVKRYLKGLACEVCSDRGYLEVTHEDNHEYIEACLDCNGFTVGSMGDATGADERAQLQAERDGYKLTKTGKIKE